jgi:hypothetical protein
MAADTLLAFLNTIFPAVPVKFPQIALMHFSAGISSTVHTTFFASAGNLEASLLGISPFDHPASHIHRKKHSVVTPSFNYIRKTISRDLLQTRKTPNKTPISVRKTLSVCLSDGIAFHVPNPSSPSKATSASIRFSNTKHSYDARALTIELRVGRSGSVLA